MPDRRTHVIEIGAEPRPFERFAFHRLGGTLTVRVPQLPDRCVCCSQRTVRDFIRYYAGVGR